MELDQIRAFVFAVDEGSVQGGARRLHRSQPAASRLIQSLEEHMGGELLDRRTRPASPTDFGRQVLDQARRALEAVDRLAGHGRKAGAADTARIRLGVSHAYTRIVASPLVSSLVKAPGCPTLSIQTGWSLALLRQLQESHLDAALLGFPAGWSPPPNLRSHLIRKEELVVIAPKGTDLPGDARLRDLAPYPWVLNSDGCGIRSQLQAEFAGQGRSLNLRIEVVGSLSQHIEFVAAGFGLGLVPRRALAVHFSRKHVRRVPLRERLSTHLWLLWHPMGPPVEGYWARTRDALVRSASPRAL